MRRVGHFHPRNNVPKNKFFIIDCAKIFHRQGQTYLNLQYTSHFGSTGSIIVKSYVPLWSPLAIPIVLWLKLMILNAQWENNLICRRIIASINGTDTMTIMICRVLNRFDVQRWTPWLGNLIWLIVLEVGCFFPQMVVLEWLLCAWISKTSSAFNRINKRKYISLLSYTNALSLILLLWLICVVPHIIIFDTAQKVIKKISIKIILFGMIFKSSFSALGDLLIYVRNAINS